MRGLAIMAEASHLLTPKSPCRHFKGNNYTRRRKFDCDDTVAGLPALPRLLPSIFFITYYLTLSLKQ